MEDLVVPDVSNGEFFILAILHYLEIMAKSRQYLRCKLGRRLGAIVLVQSLVLSFDLFSQELGLPLLLFDIYFDLLLFSVLLVVHVGLSQDGVDYLFVISVELVVPEDVQATGLGPSVLAEVVHIELADEGR